MSHPDYPSVIPLLPLRNGVLFPGTVITVPVGRARSIAMIEAVGQDAIVGIAVQRDARMVDPELADLQPVGTFAVNEAAADRVRAPCPFRAPLPIRGGCGCPRGAMCGSVMA